MGEGEFGTWVRRRDVDVLFFGGTEEEHIIASVHRNPDKSWFYIINPLELCTGGFPSREAAQAAAEAELRDAQRRAARKISFFYV